MHPAFFIILVNSEYFMFAFPAFDEYIILRSVTYVNGLHCIEAEKEGLTTKV